ncbi:hypothetical protein CDS [Bradyrhizobium sp.]|nr:hypothetical protein CDS [Bradyrhizobium sp.]
MLSKVAPGAHFPMGGCAARGRSPIRSDHLVSPFGHFRH